MVKMLEVALEIAGILGEILLDFLIDGLINTIASPQKPALLRFACGAALGVSYFALAGIFLFLTIRVDGIALRILFLFFLLLLTALFLKLCWKIYKKL